MKKPLGKYGKYKKPILWAGILLTVLVVQKSVVKPLGMKRETLLAQKGALEQELSAAQEGLRNLARLTPTQTEIEQLDGEMQRLLKANNTYTNLIRNISAESRVGAEIRVQKVVIDKQQQVGEFNRVEMTLDLVGSYLAVGKFLEGLERSELLTEVSAIELKRLGAGEIRRVTVKIKIAGYVATTAS